jgi:hypothetical protein
MPAQLTKKLAVADGTVRAGGLSVPSPVRRFFAFRKHRREEGGIVQTPPSFDVSLGTALELVLTRALSSDQAETFYLVAQQIAIKQLAAVDARDVSRERLQASDLAK